MFDQGGPAGAGADLLRMTLREAFEQHALDGLTLLRGEQSPGQGIFNDSRAGISAVLLTLPSSMGHPRSGLSALSPRADNL
jgi:hypothetical protein